MRTYTSGWHATHFKKMKIFVLVKVCYRTVGTRTSGAVQHTSTSQNVGRVNFSKFKIVAIYLTYVTPRCI